MFFVLHKCVTTQMQGHLWVQFRVYKIVCTICIPFAIKKFSFCDAPFKRILAWEGGTFRTWFLD